MKGGKRGFVGKGKGARTGQRESIVHAPYMPRLLKEILAWDYLDLLLKDRGTRGARKVKTDFHLDFQKRLRKIPLKFPDADSFQDCFEALLLEECRAEMVTGWTQDYYLKFMSELRGSKDVGKTTPQALVVGDGDGDGACSSSATGSDFRKLTLGIEMDAKNLGDVREKKRGEKDYIKEDFFDRNDVVLVSKKDPDLADAHKDLYFLAVVDRVLASVAVVEKKTPQVIEIADEDEVMEDADADADADADQERQQKENSKKNKNKSKKKEKNLHLIILQAGHQKKNEVQESLASEISEEVKRGDGTWVLSRLCNLTTITREYQAVFKLRDSKFSQVILDPTVANARNSLRHKLSLPERLSAGLTERYTANQMDTLRTALEGDKLVLIQGPPGTGKTRTICGLLSVLCNSVLAEEVAGHPAFKQRGGFDKPMPEEDQVRNWFKASPWLTTCDPRKIPTRDTDGKSMTVPQAKEIVIRKSKEREMPKILVCTPSNSALDEIVTRLIDLRLIDKIGLEYMPKIVRLGGAKALAAVNPKVEKYTLAKLKAKYDPHKYPKMEEKDIVQECQIVFSTLSNMGSKFVQDYQLKFDYVIIDEAAQAVEPSTLIPLGFDCSTCFLVGDPKQLPATIMSYESVSSFQYNQSLFARLQLSQYPVQMLTTQFRMHPSIREFPGDRFYDGKLKDSPQARTERERGWQRDSHFGPFAFYDIQYGPKGGYDKYTNEPQAKFALDVLETLTSTFPDLKESDIGIISTYKAQASLLEQMLVERFGTQKAGQIEVRTVDSFQGREKDVVIWTTVRSDEKGAIGFLKDDNRINVALTRAKSTMIVVGNARALLQSKHDTWKQLIDNSKERGVYYQHREGQAVEFKEGRTASAGRSAAAASAKRSRKG